jgi:hypothetical protein
MTRAPWLEIERFKGATIPEEIAIQVLRDIDDAVARRDPASLRNFAEEASRSGMDQEASRARELADVMTKADRDELTKIKAALETPEPTEADLVRAFDAKQLAAMFNGGPFNVNTFEADEARRAEESNRQLRERQRRSEEQRAAQAAHDARPKGPGW